MRLEESKWNPKNGFLPTMRVPLYLSGGMFLFFPLILLQEVTGANFTSAAVPLLVIMIAYGAFRNFQWKVQVYNPQFRDYCAWVDNGLPNRTRELRQVAESLGLQFDSGPSAQIPERLEPKLDLILGSKFSCSKEYMRVRNIISGEYQQVRFTYLDIFDIAFETSSALGKKHWYYKHLTSIIVMELPRFFPRLRIGPEDFGAGKAKGWSGDIDLDSHEFSDLFDIRSQDKKFAYDFCNPKMMEFLIARASLTIRIHGNLMLLPFSARQIFRNPVATIDTSWNDLMNIRSRMPNFLFDS